MGKEIVLSPEEGRKVFERVPFLVVGRLSRIKFKCAPTLAITGRRRCDMSHVAAHVEALSTALNSL